MLPPFAEKTVVDQASVVVVDRDLPFEAVALSSCGLPCGFGAVTHGAKVQLCETVLVVDAGGTGGSGLSAVQAVVLSGIPPRNDTAHPLHPPGGAGWQR